MFDTTKDDLKDILRDVHEGKLQLPEFQRDYVWSDEDVRSLIASIAKGFPVGALLTMEVGGVVNFKPRLLEGVPEIDTAPERLLLDGQQRITSLYQSMYAPRPVRTRTPRGTEVKRYYYLDIMKAVDNPVSLEDAIVGVPADKILRTNFGRDILLDLSTPENEFLQDHFPLNQVFDFLDWFFKWNSFWQARGREDNRLGQSFFNGILQRIDDYKMPIIMLDKNNGREAICLVFEKVNVGGKKLDAFELVTAVYAADGFDLRRDWLGSVKDPVQPGRRARMINGPQRRDVLSELASTDFLQACTLLHTREIRNRKAADGFRDKDLPQISCNRAALLALPRDAYLQYADSVEHGFIEASQFLNERKIIWYKDVPYPSLTIGLAAVYSVLGNQSHSLTARQKIAQWFWAVTLGELYGSSTDSRLARDVPEIVDWIEGRGDRPRSVDEALFQRDRLLTLKSRSSAAYKGIHALLMQHGCRDFISGKATDMMTFFDDQMDIHHIFPQAWCKSKGIPSRLYDSIINKSSLSRRSNIAISGDAPSVYLRRIESQQGLAPETLDDILRTHLIDPAHLRADDFDAFFESRTNALADLVSGAMGKPVVSESGANETEVPVNGDDDETGEVV